MLAVQLYPRELEVFQARLRRAVRDGVDVPAFTPQPLEYLLQAVARRQTLQFRADGGEIVVCDCVGWVREGDDAAGAPECLGQDAGDGDVGAAEVEVGEVALGGVEPGVEECCGVDGGGWVGAVEDAVDEGYERGEVEAGA